MVRLIKTNHNLYCILYNIHSHLWIHPGFQFTSADWQCLKGPPCTWTDGWLMDCTLLDRSWAAYSPHLGTGGIRVWGAFAQAAREWWYFEKWWESGEGTSLERGGEWMGPANPPSDREHGDKLALRQQYAGRMWWNLYEELTPADRQIDTQTQTQTHICVETKSVLSRFKNIVDMRTRHIHFIFLWMHIHTIQSKGDQNKGNYTGLWT